MQRGLWESLYLKGTFPQCRGCWGRWGQLRFVDFLFDWNPQFQCSSNFSCNEENCYEKFESSDWPYYWPNSVQQENLMRRHSIEPMTSPPAKIYLCFSTDNHKPQCPSTGTRSVGNRCQQFAKVLRGLDLSQDLPIFVCWFFPNWKWKWGLTLYNSWIWYESEVKMRFGASQAPCVCCNWVWKRDWLSTRS